MKDTTLVIMAAGIGSRFGGGIKQLEPVGPGGEIIMDYSIYDALQAGFDRVVFIIRRDLEKDFKEIIGRRIEKQVPVGYAYQELADLPPGCQVPAGRTKPWGTGQAVLCVKDLVHGPFLVINADDYYGREGFFRLHAYMANEMAEESGVHEMCMGGFLLANTLSENGGVTRGVCRVGGDGYLESVTETYDIRRVPGGVSAKDVNGSPVEVDAGCHVSMNMWGLPAGFIKELETGFPAFLESLGEGDVKSEYLLPTVINGLVRAGRARVKVIETPDRWFGVTYREDKQTVVDSLRALIAEGVYPEKLFG